MTQVSVQRTRAPVLEVKRTRQGTQRGTTRSAPLEGAMADVEPEKRETFALAALSMDSGRGSRNLRFSEHTSGRKEGSPDSAAILVVRTAGSEVRATFRGQGTRTVRIAF
jgi:hypothetical protein